MRWWRYFYFYKINKYCINIIIIIIIIIINYYIVK